jgi:hypothetical protein
MTNKRKIVVGGVKKFSICLDGVLFEEVHKDNSSSTDSVGSNNVTQ